MKILIVEPQADGHHSFYLRLILQAFEGHDCTILTSPVPDNFLEFTKSKFSLHPYRLKQIPSPEPETAVAATVDLARSEHFDLVFMPYIDLMLRHLARQDTTCLKRVAGIWMGAEALRSRYRLLPPLDKRLALRGELHRWLRRPKAAELVQDLFFLLEQDVDRLKHVAPCIRGHLLEDPPEAVSPLSQSQAREALQLPRDQTILLHAGSHEPRKGLGTLLDAYQMLDADQARRPFLYRVGPNDFLKSSQREILDKMVQQGRAKKIDRYVPTDDLANAFAACDWVAMPYRKFHRSSGILALARAANRPVLGSDFGHIGQQIRDGHQPGRLYRHGSTKDLALQLTTLDRCDTPDTKAPTIEQAHQTFITTLSTWVQSKA